LSAPAGVPIYNEGFFGACPRKLIHWVTIAMPIYAYKCEACGYTKDVLQKVSDAPLQTCPACGAAAFRKQVTAAGFQLKGTGWYVTDFRGGASGAAAGSAAGGDSASSDKASESSTATSQATACGASCACH
jgi:putative FmdB family regulatory protein